MATTATTQELLPRIDPRPAWIGPCRCSECRTLREVSPGLAAAYRWPAAHTREAARLVKAWREVQRRNGDALC